jgi:hypothetical protein
MKTQRLNSLSLCVNAFLVFAAVFMVVHGHTAGALLAMGAFAPAQGLGTLNVALSQYAKQFPLSTDFVAEILAPRVPVNQRSFQYLITDRAGQRHVPTLRQPGQRPSQIRMAYSTDKYFCDSHALEAPITREAGENAALLNFNLKQAATGRLMGGIQLDREIGVSAMFKTGITNTEAFTTGTTQWSDYTGVSHPIQDVSDAKYTVSKSGVEANVLALGPDVIKALTNHPDLIDRFKFTNPTGNLSLDQISAALQIKCVRAGALVVDGADVPSFVWAQTAVLAYNSPVTSQEDISAAKTFIYTGSGVDGYEVLDFPDPYLSAKRDLVSVDMIYDTKLTAQETVFTFTNVVAAE